MRTEPFLSGFDIGLGSIAADDVQRDDNGFPLSSPANVSVYRNAGIDALVDAMAELCQTKLQDSVGNTFVANSPGVRPLHAGLKTPTATLVSQALLRNSADTSVGNDEAINRVYSEVRSGLVSHFQAPFFNEVPGGAPPPGFATLLNTQIVVPPQPPPRIQAKSEYSGGTTAMFAQMFDQFVTAVESQAQLLHNGVNPTGSPITLPDKVFVTV